MYIWGASYWLENSPGTGRKLWFCGHRGQHSSGRLVCLDMGHGSTGQVFLEQVSWFPRHWHTRQRSSMEASTSWPSATVCPLILQPENSNPIRYIGHQTLAIRHLWFSWAVGFDLLGHGPRNFPQGETGFQAAFTAFTAFA